MSRPRLYTVPIAVLALGIAFSLFQQSAIPDEVFFSGDGGIKALIAKQFAAGEWHADLRVRAEPWVQDLWRKGLYPFGPPFVYAQGDRWLIQYPLPFIALSAPFYDLFGYRGFTLVPLAGLWILWISFAVLCRRLDLSWPAQAVGTGGLIFASFATPYGAMYWEHTLALGLSCAGLALLLPRPPDGAALGRDLAGGLLMGAAVWARPESVCFAAGVCLALPLLGAAKRSWIAAWAGVGVACLSFAGFNVWLYGNPLGPHALQVVDETTPHLAHMSARRIAWDLGRELVRFCPITLLVVGTSLAGLRFRQSRPTRLQGFLWVVLAVFFVGTSFVAPNTGGKQFGPRYFLPALPPLFLLVALQWDAAATLMRPWGRRAQIVALLLLGLGAYLNGVRGTVVLFQDYEGRVLPALAALREDATPIVVVEHQWMAQELVSVFDDKIFFRVRNQAELDILAGAIRDRVPRRFTLVRWRPLEGKLFRREDLGFEVHLSARGRFGSYLLVDCFVVPLPENRTTGAAKPL